MMLFITTLHIFLCVILILVILVQPGKGGDVAAAFGGGGSSTLFGPRGPASLLTRATTVVAILFMSTSIVLAVDASSKRQGTGDELEDDILRFEQEESGKTSDAPTAPSGPVIDPVPPPVEPDINLPDAADPAPSDGPAPASGATAPTEAPPTMPDAGGQP